MGPLWPLLHDRIISSTIITVSLQKHLEDPLCFPQCSDDIQYSLKYSRILVHLNQSIVMKVDQGENAVLPTSSKTSN